MHNQNKEINYVKDKEKQHMHGCFQQALEIETIVSTILFKNSKYNWHSNWWKITIYVWEKKHGQRSGWHWCLTRSRSWVWLNVDWLIVFAFPSCVCGASLSVFQLPQTNWKINICVFDVGLLLIPEILDAVLSKYRWIKDECVKKVLSYQLCILD